MQVATLLPVTLARLKVVKVDANLRTAADSLSNPGVGLLVVCLDSGEAVGVLSKSDLVRHLARAGSPDSPVKDLMSKTIISCAPHDEVCVSWQTMTARDLQNLPVLDADLKPIGILDIRDAMKALYEQEEIEVEMLVNYVRGVGYQ